MNGKPCPVCFLHTLRNNRCISCGVVTKCLACERGVRIVDGKYEPHNVDALAPSATGGPCIASGAASEIR